MKIVLEKTKYHRFALYYEYSAEMVKFCRLIKDAFGFREFSFDATYDRKRWVFSSGKIVEAIAGMYPTVDIEPQVKELLRKENIEIVMDNMRMVAKSIVREKKETDFRIDGIKGAPYMYQNVGVEFIENAGGKAIIADEPGVGKTLQALGYAVHKKFNRTLVVCPASVKFAWENEVYKWTDLTSVILDSKTDISKIDPSKNVWIINYDILPKFAQALAEVKFDYIIGDEAHMIKTPSAKRTKAFRFIALNVPNVVLLTGTPLLSRPSELFSLLNIIDPKTWTSYYSYVRRYCDAKQTRFGLDTSGVSNPEELHARINNYFIRRKKEEVLSELPPKSYIRIPILLSDEFSSEYHHAEEDLAEYLWQIGKRDHPEALTNAEAIVKINTLRQICANGKVSAATEMIETIIASGQKVLVFASFVEPLKNLIEKYKDSCVVITGETPIEDRKTAVDSFQNDPNIKVFFGGYKSAGVGITLTAASNVIFLDYAWNPADHRQAEDRAHRPGATAECLNIYQMHAMNTLDEKMANVLKRKQEIFDRVIEGEVVERDEIDMVEELLEDIMARYPKK